MPKKQLYLPKIVTGANIDEPSVNALWEDKQIKIIQAISDGIEVDTAAEKRGISSIPDIYARPLTFLSAFRSGNHPLRKQIIQEWRGLLSLLALHKVKSDLDNLSIFPVKLSDDKFSKALLHLTPKKIILQKNGTEYSWTDILLIKFNNIPIGSFSPATLVYTSSDYSSRLNALKAFPLKDGNGFLRPPGVSEGLEYVGEWLEWFIKQFNQYAQTDAKANTDYKYVGDINNQLETWLNEIKNELGIEESTTIDAMKVKVAAEPIELSKPVAFLSKYNIYNALLTPLEKEDNYDNDNKSDYSLKMARNRTEFREVIVIHRSLLAENKVLWDDTRPSELDKDTTILVDKFFKTASGTKINNIDLAKDKSIWIRPDLYFLTDTLIRGKNGNILNPNEEFLNAGSADYILPFRKEILSFFSPDEIRELLKPEFEESENKVIFSFSIPIKNGQSIDIKKVFRRKSVDVLQGDGTIMEIDIPVLEIFPNYIGDFWCQYFMLCSDTDKFLMEPLNYDVDSNGISIIRQEQKFETNNSKDKADIVRISGANSFPEGILIKSKNASNADLGLIILNKDKEIEGKYFNGSCSVGIDFGTSNTNIYYKKSDENPEKWKFSFSKYLRSVLKSPESKRNDLSKLFFVPINDQELPTPTALRIFSPGITANMLLDHFLYFPNEYRYPNNVHTNIKWDDDSANLNLYIKSLIFLLIVDLMQRRVGTIDFRCSYPKSFSDDRQTIYKNIWEKIIFELFHVDGNNNKLQSYNFIFVKNYNRDEDDFIITTKYGDLKISIKPKFETEGIAAGEYFSNEQIVGIENKADRSEGSICIDVGGGTSDYSIWFKDRISLDTSVLLAGSQISKLLRNNPRVLNILLSSDAMTALNEVKENALLFSSRLNFILKKEEKSIAANLVDNANNKDIAWLRRILAIEFGALSFYSAHLCIALDDFLHRKLSEAIIKKGIKLHWGGNAAKFINWIDYGRYEKDGIASKFLNGMFVNTIYDQAIGDKKFKPKLLTQVQSPGHKDEASGGIVVMDFYRNEEDSSPDDDIIDGMILDKKGIKKEILDGIIIGENVSVNNSVMEHYHVINKNDFFINNVSSFNETNLEQLKRFIYLINQVGNRTGLFPEGAQINLSLQQELAIQQGIKNDIASLAKIKPERRNIEPIFIMEVKYLLDILSNKMK